MNKQSIIKMSALGLGVGSSMYIHCPYCINIEQQRPKMSVTRQPDGLLYFCHRANCGKAGFVSDYQLEGDCPPRNDFEPRIFTGSTESLPDHMLSILYTDYYITEEVAEQNGILKIYNRNGILLPLFDSTGKPFGHTTKYFDGHKAYHFITEPGDHIHYPRSDRKRDLKTIMLVEDVLSSIRCAEFIDSGSLLGTNVSTAKLESLLNQGYTDIILGLDPDAFIKALRIKRNYLIPSAVHVIKLTNDPKDLPPQRLEEEIKNVLS